MPESPKRYREVYADESDFITQDRVKVMMIKIDDDFMFYYAARQGLAWLQKRGCSVDKERDASASGVIGS